MQDTSSKKINRRYLHSSSFAMALLFALLGGLVAATQSYYISYFSDQKFAQSIAAAIDAEIKYIEAVGDIPEPQSDRLYAPIPNNARFPEFLPQDPLVLEDNILIFEIRENKTFFAAKAVKILENQDILIGLDVSETYNDYRMLSKLGIANVIFIGLIVLISFGISRFVVNGTNNIMDTALGIIETGDLSVRVGINSRWDDLSNVANVLNVLLDRIQTLVDGVRSMSDNIAHDLRTPLTRMRNHIDELRKKSPEADTYTDLLSEADHIMSTFNALHRITRIETEQKKSQFKTVSLDAIVHDIVEFYDPLAEQKDIKVITHIDPITFFGDRDLLMQAIANILDNAIKYGSESGTITVVLRKEENKVTLAIENTGEMISSEDLKQIFDRYYRTDKSRSKPGMGLGLSLVAAIVSLHKGKIWAQNTARGVKFIATF